MVAWWPYAIGVALGGLLVLVVVLFATMTAHKQEEWRVYLGVADILLACLWVGTFASWVIGRSTA